jgi:hypothetical protein
MPHLIHTPLLRALHWLVAIVLGSRPAEDDSALDFERTALPPGFAQSVLAPLDETDPLPRRPPMMRMRPTCRTPRRAARAPRRARTAAPSVTRAASPPAADDGPPALDAAAGAGGEL